MPLQPLTKETTMNPIIHYELMQARCAGRA
jgi:hypothetical protein